MITIGFLIFGALLGAYRARKRNGSGFDIAQYAAVYGLIFTIIGLFVSILISRLA